MQPPQHPSQLLADHLEGVYAAARYIARRHGLDPEEAEDFRGWVVEHLVGNDYAAIRRFRGESSLKTYLTVVVASQMRDFRAARQGRWRASAEAMRLGPPAPRLETLVRRKGYALHEAGELLRTSGETTLSDRELGILLARLPARGPMRPVPTGEAELLKLVAPQGAGTELEAREEEDERARVLGLLERELGALADEDRAVLRMHFWEGATVQAIARALGVPPKPLYRRMERLRTQLRGRLEAAGVGRTEFLSSVDH